MNHGFYVYDSKIHQVLYVFQLELKRSVSEGCHVNLVVMRYFHAAVPGINWPHVGQRKNYF